MYKSVPFGKIIEMAHDNSKYNTKTSKVNKKWVRFLKRNKLFDEYMIYLANYNAVGAEPKSYKQLSNVCHNLSLVTFNYKGKRIAVDWTKKFNEFAWPSIKWYDIKNIFLYIKNRKYV